MKRNWKTKLRDISLAIIGGILFFAWIPIAILNKIIDIIKK